MTELVPGTDEIEVKHNPALRRLQSGGKDRCIKR